MGWISWILLGLVVGVLAKWIMPGKDPGCSQLCVRDRDPFVRERRQRTRRRQGANGKIMGTRRQRLIKGQRPLTTVVGLGGGDCLDSVEDLHHCVGFGLAGDNHIA